jgi:RNAse (barnase) inhibitor barstar
MSTSLKITLGVFGSVLIIFIIGCGTIVGINNKCVKLEAGIEAQYKQNQNNYDNYFKKLKEIAQVPEMYVADLKKVWDGVMGGRYGKNGSRAAWQWIKEHNPKLDVSLYKKIQSVIEAGRADFETNQKMLLDKKMIYEIYLGTFPSGFIASVLGFPKKDLNSMDIVTSEETKKIFETKKSDYIKLK